jgi:NADPH:quinone reductase-like Zn-dependent oxidoreductase
MKCVYLEEFGKPTVTKTTDVPKLKDGELLIKVHAAPINPSDVIF